MTVHRRLRRFLFGFPLLLTLASGSAVAQEPILGEAPVVGGNVSGAREKALAEAFRKAVETVFDEVRLAISGAPAAVAALRDVMGQRARRYVRSFRLVEQAEEGGYVRVKLTVDVDRVAITREIEGVGGNAASPSVPGVVVAGGDPAAAVFTKGLQLRGVRAHQGSGAPAVGQLLVQILGSDNLLLPVRGTRTLAAACELKVKIVRAGPGADTTVTGWGFAEDEASARADCLNRAADVGVGKLAADFPPGRVDGGDDVVLSLTVVEPDLLALVLTALRRTPALRSSTVVGLRAQGADIRVATALRADAVVAALGRTLGDTALVVPQKATASRIDLDVRRKGTP